MNEPHLVQHRQCSRPSLLAMCMIVSSIGIETVLMLLWFAVLCLPASSQNAFTTVWTHAIRFVDFPWSMAVVVWMAARYGEVGYRTYVVPIGILIAGVSIQASIEFFLTIPNNSFESEFTEWTSSYWYRGIASVGTLLTGYICLSLMFRLATLHLRPLQSKPMPFHLTTRSMLILTLLSAVLSLGYVFLNQMNVQPVELRLYGDNFTQEHWLVMIVGHLPINSLAWFSIAWLQVCFNERRWIGWIGLLVYLLFTAIYHFVVYNLNIQSLLSQNQQVPSHYAVELINAIAVSVVQLGFVFASVRLMHACGYRWVTNRSASSIA